ncbi:MAG: hypothetical protein ACFB50_09430, partial [Rubrobacteraceae bacterium]
MLDTSGVVARRTRDLSLGRLVALFVVATVVAMAVLGTLGATGAQAAGFVVNTTDDGSDTDSPGGPYDGVCDADTADGNQCTLRAAIEEANNNGEPDSITIPAEFTIRLTLGELQI